MKNAHTFNMNDDKRKCWMDSFSIEFRKCPYCGANWCREFIENIFVKFCPKCGNRVFKEQDQEEQEQ